MNSEILQGVLEEASALTSSLPAQVQEVAFSKVFDALLAEHTARSRRSNSMKASRGAGPRAGSLNAHRIGPKLALGQLVDGGYFGVRRSLPEIQAHLRDSCGRDYASNELSISLLRLMRDARLSREKDSSGQYAYWAKSIARDVGRRAMRGPTRLLTDGVGRME